MDNTKRVKKYDYLRVLVTETLPYETPIIFSNDGLYNCIGKKNVAPNEYKKLIEFVVEGKNDRKKISCTIPFVYKIRKDESDFRKIFLIHPFSQMKAVNFYKEFEDLIVNFCAISPASIRSPIGIASTYYKLSKYNNLYKYKKGLVAEREMDELTKHSPSFFSYRGYVRLYKFFDSPLFKELELSYSFMRTLDVSKCFDSIYTHSMSWVVKEKKFTKSNINVTACFPQEFDALMRHMNYGETNGIVIGPELSRIFAEIIFQKIDIFVIEKIKKELGFDYGVEYCFKRYVDDVFIFAKNKLISDKVYSFYCSELSLVNLSANSLKSREYNQPFVTEKSQIISDVKNIVNDFVNKFLAKTEDNNLQPLKVRSRWNLARSFFNAIKSACKSSDSTYNDVSSFVVAALSERIKLILDFDSDQVVTNDLDYKESLLVLIDVSFFFYRVAPSVSASYRICSAMLVIFNFIKNNNNVIYGEIYEKVYENINRFVQTFVDQKNVEFLPLELLNIVLITREMPDYYRFKEGLIKKIFFPNGKESYFGIVGALFYMQDKIEYREFSTELVNKIYHFFDCGENVSVSSEEAHLLFDIISCPFIKREVRRKILNFCAKRSGLGDGFLKEENMNNFFSFAEKNTVHINWKNISILTMLGKKELRRAY